MGAWGRQSPDFGCPHSTARSLGTLLQPDVARCPPGPPSCGGEGLQPPLWPRRAAVVWWSLCLTEPVGLPDRRLKYIPVYASWPTINCFCLRVCVNSSRSSPALAVRQPRAFRRRKLSWQHGRGLALRSCSRQPRPCVRTPRGTRIPSLIARPTCTACK